MSKIQKFIFDPSFWLVRHGLFWVILYLDTFRYLLGFDGEWDLYDLGDDLLTLFIDMLLVYINLYILIPKLALKDKVLQYAFWTGLSFFIIILINSIQIGYYLEDGDDYPMIWRLYDNALATIGVLAPAIAIKISKHFSAQAQHANLLKEQNLIAELNTLKNQVNPHFLFNALNNLFILSKEKSDKAPDTILQLADLMRYQTYEASKEKVNLQKEIDFISNYLNLEILRRDNLKAEQTVNGNPKSIVIAPLLFLPFVENACKYSNKSDGSEEEIEIIWTIENEKIRFSITNNKSRINLRNDDFGVGIANVQKRLNLLFPNEHNLIISDKEDTFKVDLSINTQ